MIIRKTIAALLLLGATATGFAQPEAFPSRPITFVVPYPPGGGGDLQARMVGTRISENLNQQVIVENRSGGGGIIAAQLVKRANPDGYMLLQGNIVTHAINPSLYSKLPYDPVKDFQPITLLMKFSSIIAVRAESPIKSLEEMLALAKSKPGGLTYASPGPGSSSHLNGETLKSLSGADLRHVAYRGSAPAIQDTLGGNVDMLIDAVGNVSPHVAGGRLRALAVFSKERDRSLPQVPATEELGYKGVDITYWLGVYAPAGTPQPVVRRLHAEFVKASQNPAFIKDFSNRGFVIETSTPEELAAVMKYDTERLGKLIRTLGLKID